MGLRQQIVRQLIQGLFIKISAISFQGRNFDSAHFIIVQDDNILVLLLSVPLIG